MLYKETSFAIIGAAIEVQRHLGPGFGEQVYDAALARELERRSIPFDRQVPLVVRYKDEEIGKYRPDFLVDGIIIIEVKAVAALLPVHRAQVLHYLAATGLRLALLLNFGTKPLGIKRIIK